MRQGIDRRNHANGYGVLISSEDAMFGCVSGRQEDGTCGGI